MFAFVLGFTVCASNFLGSLVVFIDMQRGFAYAV